MLSVGGPWDPPIDWGAPGAPNYIKHISFDIKNKIISKIFEKLKQIEQFRKKSKKNTKMRKISKKRVPRRAETL